MKELSDYLEMALKSAEYFANDGKIDANELGKLLAIAERDGKIDRNEIRVLRNVIARIDLSEVDDALRDRLKEISAKINK